MTKVKSEAELYIEALKPCPFCGKEACWNMGHHVIMCHDDNCPAGFVFVEPKAWNTRADTAPPAQAEE